MKLSMMDWLKIYDLLKARKESIESNWRFSEGYYKDENGNSTYEKDPDDVKEYEHISRLMKKFETLEI